MVDVTNVLKCLSFVDNLIHTHQLIDNINSKLNISRGRWSTEGHKTGMVSEASNGGSPLYSRLIKLATLWFQYLHTIISQAKPNCIITCG